MTCLSLLYICSIIIRNKELYVSHTYICIVRVFQFFFFLQIILISFGIRERSSTAHKMHQDQEGYDRRNVSSVALQPTLSPIISVSA